MSYMSSLTGRSIIHTGEDGAKYTKGYCASASAAYPGHAFTRNQTTPSQFDSTSTGVLTENFVWLAFEPRTSETFGEVDIDTAYSTSDNVKFLIPTKGVVWWAACNDLGADYYGGRKLQMADSGNLALFDNTSEWCCAIIDHDYKYTNTERFLRVRNPVG